VARYLPKSALSEWQNHGDFGTCITFGLMHACLHAGESQQGSKEKTSINIVFLDGARILPSFQGSMDGILRAGKDSEGCGERHSERGEKEAIEWEKASHGVDGSALLVGSLFRRGNLQYTKTKTQPLGEKPWGVEKLLEGRIKSRSSRGLERWSGFALSLVFSSLASVYIICSSYTI